MNVEYCLDPDDDTIYSYDDDSLDNYFTDDSQAFHADQLPPQDNPNYCENIAPVEYPDPAIAFSHSLEQSKELIQKQFSLDSNSFHTSNVYGIVVLPLKDFNLIRKDNRFNRELKHLLVIPSGDNFPIVHPDFAQAIQVLNSN